MPRPNRAPLIKVVLCLLPLLLLSACTKVNKDNYQKLKLGMDYDEVVSLLGEPESCESVLNAQSCVWGKSPKTITVRLIGDKVVVFSSSGL